MTITLRSNFLAENRFYQPQMTRYHHAFRSPISSQKLNLVYGQLSFDIKKLYAKVYHLRNQISSSLEVLTTTSSNSVAVVLGFFEAVEFASVYDINGDGVLDTTSPITSSYKFVNSSGTSTNWSTLFDSDIAFENLSTKIQRLVDRITILEEGL